jgi:uncharacterized protein YjbI with pentapeptide repeats
MKLLFKPICLLISLVLFYSTNAQAAEANWQKMTRDEVVEVLSQSSPENGANLELKDFRGLDLSGVDFSGANLFYTHMKSADLSNGIFDNANLDLALMMSANLENASFKNAALNNTNLENSNLKNANFSGARVVAKMSRADLIGANLSNMKAGISMHNQSMGMIRTELESASLRDVTMKDADLAFCNMKFAKLQNSDLRGVNFSNCDLSGADFTGANLTDANLTEAKLTNTRFYGITGKETIKGLDKAVDKHLAKFD